MARSGELESVWRSTDLFGDSHRGLRSRFAWCSTSRCVETEGPAAIDRGSARHRKSAIPDHTTLSRRGGGLTVLPKSFWSRRTRCISSSTALV